MYEAMTIQPPVTRSCEAHARAKAPAALESLRPQACVHAHACSSVPMRAHACPCVRMRAIAHIAIECTGGAPRARA
eukprot:6212398-Pleurochrysis_carterae.AAC.3